MSEIRLNKSAYTHNLTQICNKAGGKERVILVLKDNAYGHGALLIAPVAKEFGIKFCAVKNEKEAHEIGEFFDKILILSHIPNKNESQNFIYGINDIYALNSVKDGTRIHLAIDTIMHRNGLCIDELDSAFDVILSKNLKLEGAYTHFRASDEMNADYFVQKQKFSEAKVKILAFCDKFRLLKPIFHSHNSAGVERFSDMSDDMVRVGIAQHGYAQFNDSLNLQPVLSLWAQRISQRVLKAGQCVGYGAKFCATSDINIATYDLGYGDGLLRYTGDGDLTLANGKRLLGKMSMDSFSCENCGEMVCVFDDANVWAQFFNTINYDVLTKLSPFIDRKWQS
ncbi:alanine racemase [Campylobacter sp. RM9344]|uniref:Alanine racemase n=1 Tax=Campylobacter californiensis TaxID=1032243 RepID=A0AAW3ZWC5_9BACT|nr:MULTISPECIES: alanine racemase [unclassified Campylobacter]MBE2984920.1 alanine racemase [Campylobacter sp. RM6883]MBE2986353.1 alanine racemase [Campylobacter sp. RM12919]MBE2988016.1 alanine racemase [Campylobacter sp. RM12920]MBE2995304.1 alanine racemase [Campylobacter sp. RM6913]MBE3022389.1 alanine racemase [Campylobacter sp. 7477a]MBE3029361.1 alanine racemase [Campylobacter sp. RM9344]